MHEKPTNNTLSEAERREVRIRTLSLYHPRNLARWMVEAEAERDELRADIATLRAELNDMGDAVNVVDHNYREAMTALARADERAKRAEAERDELRAALTTCVERIDDLLNERPDMDADLAVRDAAEDALVSARAALTNEGAPE